MQTFGIVGAVLVFSVVSMIARRVSWNMRDQTEPSDWRSQYWMGVSTEMVGAIVTTVVLVLGLELVIVQRQDIRAEIDRLVIDMRQGDADAVSELRANRWLSDGSLDGRIFSGVDLPDIDLSEGRFSRADFSDAVLTGVDLSAADLRGARFEGTILTDAMFDEADLREINLRDARLVGVSFAGLDLTGADLRDTLFDSSKDIFNGAILTGANISDHVLTEAPFDNTVLTGVNFENTVLRRADLRGKDLTGANLKEADLTGVRADENTILPDGSGWTSNQDFERFTDPAHVDFWRSSDPDSPAYEGR